MAHSLGLLLIIRDLISPILERNLESVVFVNKKKNTRGTLAIEIKSEAVPNANDIIRLHIEEQSILSSSRNSSTTRRL